MYKRINNNLLHNYKNIQNIRQKFLEQQLLNIPFFETPSQPTQPLLPYSTSTEVIIGYRWWHIKQTPDDAYRLVSAFVNAWWVPGAPMTGIINIDYPSSTLGVHAYNTQLLSNNATNFMHRISYTVAGGPNDIFPRLINGTVSLWGKIICTEFGYRAEFAYPKKLFVPKHIYNSLNIANALKNTYGVEVDLV